MTLGDLVERDGLYYEKFTDVPYAGEVTGDEQGSFKNGEKDGAWVSYWENGQLFYKENYKNGMKDGTWARYYESGQLWSTDNYESGFREGAWVYYHENGQLAYKGNFKNGRQEGAWVYYQIDGTVMKSSTGTFKDGVKISD